MIEVKKLYKNYGNVRAVQGIDFSIKDGEIVGFLGSNGAGKSTTLKILSGYLSPSSGQISINNLDIMKDSHEIKKIIGYLPESNPLYNDMMVYDLLEFTAKIRKIPNNEFKDALDKVVMQCGLNGILHKNVGACSKGYKQRVGLACAMIHNPKILILDEPVTGLDPNQIVEIRELIKNLGKEKLVIMSSHILQEIEATVDRIIIIDQGKIIADGSTKKIINSNKGNIQLQLEIIGAKKEELKNLENEISNIKISKILKLKSGYIINLEYAQKNDPREQLFKLIVKSKWTLLEMTPKSENLEDIFRKLTGNKS
tara:strand:- start:1414 stop:2349 length:936 start_codon:yes stop_codon:yes gene_type:complete